MLYSLINFTTSNIFKEVFPPFYIRLLLSKSFFKKHKNLLSYSSILLFSYYSYLFIYFLRTITYL